MKKVNENLELLEELFETWAEEVSESVLDVFDSLNSDYLGHAVIDATGLYYNDILKLEEALRSNGFKIDIIENEKENWISIWFSSIENMD